MARPISRCIAATCTRRWRRSFPPDRVHLGKRLVGLAARGDRVALTFADGSEVETGAVIGADGVHSLVREHVADQSRRASPAASPIAPRSRPRGCAASRSARRARNGGGPTATS